MIRFVPRLEPLAPIALEARDAVALGLVRRWLERGLGTPPPLAIAAGKTIIAMGDVLPWVAGARWLGRDPEAPELLLPTRCALVPHPALVLAALRRARDPRAFPLALVPGEGDRIHALPLGLARPIGRAELEAFVERVEAT